MGGQHCLLCLLFFFYIKDLERSFFHAYIHRGHTDTHIENDRWLDAFFPQTHNSKTSTGACACSICISGQRSRGQARGLSGKISIANELTLSLPPTTGSTDEEGFILSPRLEVPLSLFVRR